MFDLTISTLSDRSGAQQDLPGLYIASAPRKAARLRAQDQLLVYMKVSGNASLSPAEQQEYLSKVADAYFTSSGPITSGLKAAITTLNDLLMQRNVRGAKEGQVIAVASVAALHAGTIMMAQAGATHTFVLGKDETQHFHDPVGGRSLGISHQAVPRFYQTSITPGDFLLFSASPSTAWSAKSLSGSGQLSMDHLRRRLMGQAGADHEGVVARVQNGKGKVNWFRPVPADPGAAETRRAEPSASQPANRPRARSSGPLRLA